MSRADTTVKSYPVPGGVIVIGTRPRPKSCRRAAIALGMAAVLALTACGSDSDSPSDTARGESGGSFIVGLPSFFVQNFTPGATASSYVDYALWTPLTQTEPGTGELQMMVAESMESDDQQSWTITLKTGWTFHDGSPVTAQSFADSWNATALGTNALAGNYLFANFQGYAEMNPADGTAPADSLSGVTVVDETTLEVVLNEPNALLPYIMSSTAFAPLPESGLSDLAAFGTNPIGNGPFKMREGGFATGDQDVFLERYEDYAGESASADEIDLRIYQDTGAVFTDFQAGSIDLALLDGSDLTEGKEQFPDQIVDVQFPAVIYLGFPLYDERFANPDLRMALSMAIDRDAIVNALLAGNGTVATGLVPETLTGGGGSACDSCTFDVDAAADLLESAGGWGGPMVLYTYQDPTNERILEAVANQIRTNLGIEDVTFQAQEIGQLYESYAAQTIDGPSLLYAGAPFPHIYAMADQLFSEAAGLNTTGYSSPEFASLLAEAASAASPDETTSLATQAAELALSEVPITPLFWPKGGLAHSERLDNIVPETLGGAYLAGITVTD